MFFSYPWFSTDQMSLIQDEQMNVLNILSLFPSAWQHIPLFWRANDHVTLKNYNTIKLTKVTKYSGVQT